MNQADKAGMTNQSAACWDALRAHRAGAGDVCIRDLFGADPARFDNYSLECCGLFLDYSKNPVTDETLHLLFELLRAAGFDEWRARLLSGGEVNTTEQRPALHTALRRPPDAPLMVAGRDVMREVADVRSRIGEISGALRRGEWRGASGAVVRDVVSIGIGGSHLGPLMASRAFAAAPPGDTPSGGTTPGGTLSHGTPSGGTTPHSTPDGAPPHSTPSHSTSPGATPPRTAPRVHFVSGAACGELERLLPSLDPARTLFIIVSKSFTTPETLHSARRAADWLGGVAHGQFIAVSGNAGEVRRFGIAPEHHLPLPQWVGGRHSLCAAAGLPFAIHAGMDAFEEMLAGAHCMDRHFEQAPPQANAPVILALLDVWYVNFHGAQSRAVLPYDDELALLPAYLQQLEMESNGKSVDRQGRALVRDSAPVVWGGNALEGQHAFYQLLHQGTRLVPADFIISARPAAADAWPCANFLAQSHLLMHGVEASEPWRRHAGDRPVNALMLRRLTPRTLGALIALYEHKVFTQSVVWNINPFDQSGVEAGKTLARGIHRALQSGADVGGDASTRGLARRYREWGG